MRLPSQSPCDSVFVTPSAQHPKTMFRKKKICPFWHDLIPPHDAPLSHVACFLTPYHIQMAELLMRDVWQTNGWSRGSSFMEERVDDPSFRGQENKNLSRHTAFRWLNRVQTGLSPLSLALIHGVCLEMWSRPETLTFLNTSSPQTAKKTLERALDELGRLYKNRV